VQHVNAHLNRVICGLNRGACARAAKFAGPEPRCAPRIFTAPAHRAARTSALALDVTASTAVETAWTKPPPRTGSRAYSHSLK
jgi:hypothetical protein